MAARGLGDRYQGMNWCRKDLRLAIYLRDGMACMWSPAIEATVTAYRRLTPAETAGDGAAPPSPRRGGSRRPDEASRHHTQRETP